MGRQENTRGGSGASGRWFGTSADSPGQAGRALQAESCLQGFNQDSPVLCIKGPFKVRKTGKDKPRKAKTLLQLTAAFRQEGRLREGTGMRKGRARPGRARGRLGAGHRAQRASQLRASARRRGFRPSSTVATGGPQPGDSASVKRGTRTAPPAEGCHENQMSS